MRFVLPILAAALALALALAVPSAAQPSTNEMRGCEPGEAGLPLVGRVTDARTGEPLDGAIVIVNDYPLGSADDGGCYGVIGGDEIYGAMRRVQVVYHRYEAADTLLDISRMRSDTVHFALHPSAPGYCRLEGEWSIELMLDAPGERQRPRADRVRGRMVFSDRLPSRWGEKADPRMETGRFGVDLSTFFGGPYAPDVSTSIYGGSPSDFLVEASGEVLADDSVMIVMIPGMSHGGLSLDGTIRGDTVRGAWIQNAYCCGARGRFVMHRTPPSAAGDSLVERGIRAMEKMRAAVEKEEAARSAREGRLRLRVWDEGTGRYVEVAFAAEGHKDNADGGSSSIAYRSGEDGWGPVHPFEPGTYDLLVYTFTCRGEERMGDWVDPGPDAPRFTVTIQSGR